MLVALYTHILLSINKFNYHKEGPSALANDDDFPEDHNITNLGNNKEYQKISRNLHALNT